MIFLCIKKMCDTAEFMIVFIIFICLNTVLSAIFNLMLLYNIKIMILSITTLIVKNLWTL